MMFPLLMYVETCGKPISSKLFLSALMLIMLLPPTLTPRSNATNTFIDFNSSVLDLLFVPCGSIICPAQKLIPPKLRFLPVWLSSPQIKSIDGRYRRAIQSAFPLDISTAQWRTLPNYNQQLISLEVI